MLRLSMARTGPRLFCIPAARAPIVAVLRRGPSAWSHVGRWDVARGVYEPGAWIRANLYPQRCDLSPDGRWLCYFTLKSAATWAAGTTYIALSRLPWLTALAAWRTCGTWTRGLHFVDRRRTWQVGSPDVGDAAACRRRFGLAGTRAATYAVERRRGWTETAASPPRDPSDPWEVRRAEHVAMEKVRPRSDGKTRLVVQGSFAAFRSGGYGVTKTVQYSLVANGRIRPLAGVQWADWGHDGRLLIATADGRLQIADAAADAIAVAWEVDLAPLVPDPSPPPAVARRW
jgi:hypothetical protein